jgi:hypothetical protein
MNSGKPQKLSRFAIQIGGILYATKITARSLLKRRPMANVLRAPVKEPHRKTLREIEFDLWARELDKRVEAKVATSNAQKLLDSPKNG